MSKKILVTGAGRGFGYLIVRTLLKNGHTVIASMRELGGRNKSLADDLKRVGALVVEIDVTSDSSVERGVKMAQDQAGSLDVVVNNAGVGVLGIQETFTSDDWKRVFDVNVIGVQRVNRAVLPLMRKNGEGLLLHISSLLGRMTIPFYGPYNASKWALEALAENYRTELSSFGVDVCVVEPGGYATSFMENLVKPSDADRITSYGAFANVPQRSLENFEKALAANPAQNPQNVANAVTQIVDTPAGQRPFRTVVDVLGMGAAIEPYNQQLATLTAQVYNAFGMADTLKLKTKVAQ
jgi:NAD(P)-dependent dehydrogenase (short-subunit alcohol dehydrogenase family)